MGRDVPFVGVVVAAELPGMDGVAFRPGCVTRRWPLAVDVSLIES